jgi:hypothetical protein
MIILLRLEEKLCGQSIPASLLSDQIRFIHDPFEGIRFKIKSGSWALRFQRANAPSLRFIGACLSIRFVDWVLNMIMGVATFIGILRQAIGVRSMATVIREILITSETSFTLRFTHDFCTPLSVAFGLLPPGQDGLYAVYPGLTPHVCFYFGRHVQLRRFLMHLMKNRTISSYFGPFLNTSFIPLHELYSVFSDGPNTRDWSIGSLRDDRSFFVIYQRSHSANFLLKPSQTFQMIVPSIGKSTLLQIPLEALAQFRHSAKLSHVTLKLHMSQLRQFKEIIEQFFHGKDKLSEIGFVNFRFNEGDLTCSYPKTLASIRLHCVLKPKHFAFEIGGDGELARNLKTFLNFKFDSIETQVLVVRFVVNLFELETRFSGWVIQFATAMLGKTDQFGIDWTESMARSAVITSELKVSFHFVTQAALAFAVEFTKRPGETTPEMVAIDAFGVSNRPRSIKELAKWIDNLEL